MLSPLRSEISILQQKPKTDPTDPTGAIGMGGVGGGAVVALVRLFLILSLIMALTAGSHYSATTNTGSGSEGGREGAA